jgi:hypothetical protein
VVDPTAVVAIAGLMGTGLGAFLSYKAGLATSKEETERLREQHREEERRNRQGTYHQLVTLVNELMWVDRKNLGAVLDRWYFVSAGITLFGAPEVVEKTRLLSDVIAKGSEGQSDEWRDEIRLAAREVVAAMRADIGVAPVPHEESG